MVTSKYTVVREGFQGTVTMPDGSTKYTGLYCRADEYVLDAQLKNMVKAGIITDFKIDWVRKEVEV